MKPIRMLVAAAIGVVLTLGLVSAPAYAACSGNGCDGKDAVNQGCSGDARTIESQGFYGASFKETIEVRYSPACFAVWARFSASTPSEYGWGGYRITIREYDANKNFITQYATDVGPRYEIYHLRTKMLGYGYTRYFRACFRYRDAWGEPTGQTYCSRDHV